MRRRNCSAEIKAAAALQSESTLKLRLRGERTVVVEADNGSAALSHLVSPSGAA